MTPSPSLISNPIRNPQEVMNQEMNLDKCRTAEVLIVGAGLTGSLISRHLQGKVSGLSVWEKAEDAGGRMYTHRQNLIGQPCADLGAQVKGWVYSLSGWQDNRVIPNDDPIG